MGENHFATVPTAALRRRTPLCRDRLLRAADRDHRRARAATPRSREALGSDWKGKLSPVAYASAIGLAFVYRWIAVGIYVGVALWWLVPDRRLERGFAAP